MEILKEENPYQSPVESADHVVLREAVLRRASLAWQFPLVGALLFVATIFVNWLPFATSLYFLLVLAMLGFWVGGLLMTVYAVLAAQRHSGALRHGVQGMLCNAMLTGVILLGVVGYAYLVAETRPTTTNPPASAKP
ncbi:hypothetical protein DTL42_01040 [Bremerella cremea]|uniref:Uncharacterized protein n=1 Tax=Bremerella cremea TaxID=1031537 RepID=A0A368KXM9_9BACT|nr:hypothetical protein [Bremerella cremea]RCS56003.1 hypothetical protein DTL42_01040 [Bremerella cremea]